MLFSIYGTPAWANGGLGANHAPTRSTDLRNFALAAAKRYGGQFPDGQGGLLPPVKEWLAWNEPNNPLFLAPQFVGENDPFRDRLRQDLHGRLPGSARDADQR